jgi:hypothetical protein
MRDQGRRRRRNAPVDYLAVLVCCLVVLAVEARMYMRSLGGIPLSGPVPPGYELFDESVWVQKFLGVYRPLLGSSIGMATSVRADREESRCDGMTIRGAASR